MTCSRMPKLSVRPTLARRHCARGAIFSATASGGSPQVRYLSMVRTPDGDAGVGRAAEIKRRPARLHRREQQPAVFDGDVLAAGVHDIAREQVVVDVEEFARHVVALVVRQEDAVAGIFGRVAAGDDIDQETAAGEAVERRRHARRNASATAGRAAPPPESAAAR